MSARTKIPRLVSPLHALLGHVLQKLQWVLFSRLEILEKYNTNGGQTRHTNKSDKPLCFADFVKLQRDDRGSQTKKGTKKPTKARN